MLWPEVLKEKAGVKTLDERITESDIKVIAVALNLTIVVTDVHTNSAHGNGKYRIVIHLYDGHYYIPFDMKLLDKAIAFANECPAIGVQVVTIEGASKVFVSDEFCQ